MLRQELREIEPGDAARDLRKAGTDALRLAIAQVAQLPVDLAPARPLGADALQLVVGSRAHREPGPVVEQHLQLLDVVAGHAAHHGVHAAGVVADHPAERAVVVGGGVGRERQVVLLGALAQAVEDQPGLHARAARRRIEPEDAVDELRGVDHQRHVAALAGERSAAAARDDRGAVLVRAGHRLDDVLHRARDHHSDRHLPVVRAVRGVQGAAPGVEPDLAGDAGAQGAFEGPDVDARLRVGRTGAEPHDLLQVGLHRLTSN